MTLVQANLEQQILIRQQLNEDLNTKDSYLQIIKDWLLQEPHLPDTWDDVPLMNFLRGCSFSLEKCKKKLDAYFTARTSAPELFSNRTFKNAKLLNVSKEVYHTPLPTLTKEGYRVIIMRFKYKNTFSDMEESMKLNFMILDLLLRLEEAGVAGNVVIMDAETFTSHHFVLFNPTLVKKYLVSVFDVYPIKIKGIHIININPMVNVFFTWVKPFLKSKIKDRVHFHPDGLESLYKFVPKEVLPKEYGGSAGTLQEIHDPWLQKLEECEQWFMEQENLKSDESRRSGKHMGSGELFGLEGSFKQLSVD